MPSRTPVRAATSETMRVDAAGQHAAVGVAHDADWLLPRRRPPAAGRRSPGCGRSRRRSARSPRTPGAPRRRGRPPCPGPSRCSRPTWCAAPPPRGARRTSRPGSRRAPAKSSSACTCRRPGRRCRACGSPRTRPVPRSRSFSSVWARGRTRCPWAWPGPAALDEADAVFVEQPGHRQLVRDRVGNAFPLRAVAQGGVEDVEGLGRDSSPRPGHVRARPLSNENPLAKGVGG